MNPFIQKNVIDVGKKVTQSRIVISHENPIQQEKSRVSFVSNRTTNGRLAINGTYGSRFVLTAKISQIISAKQKTMIGKLNYTYVYPSCQCIIKTNSRYFIFLDVPDHNGLTISPSEQEFLDFPGLIKRLNAKHAMEHGGVFLKPPVALPTLDLHHHDQKREV